MFYSHAMASGVLDVMSHHTVDADGDGYARVRARRRTLQLASQVFGAHARRSKMRSDSAWLEAEPRRSTSRPQQPHDAVDVDGKVGPSLALVAIEVRLTLGDNALGVAVDNALERLIVVLGDRYDLHRLRPFIRSGARIAAGPYRWAIFYALRHPVAHGG